MDRLIRDDEEQEETARRLRFGQSALVASGDTSLAARAKDDPNAALSGRLAFWIGLDRVRLRGLHEFAQAAGHQTIATAGAGYRPGSNRLVGVVVGAVSLRLRFKSRAGRLRSRGYLAGI